MLTLGEIHRLLSLADVAETGIYRLRNARLRIPKKMLNKNRHMPFSETQMFGKMYKSTLW